jgi:hypothetical protein
VPPKKEATTEQKKRGPVKYLAFAEIKPDVWALVANNREASSVYALRKELRAEVSAAQADSGVAVDTGVMLVIIPLDQAHIVEAAQQITVEETFTKTELREPAPLGDLLAPVQLDPEAAVAARMGAGPVPEGAVTTFPAAVVSGEQAAEMLAPFSGGPGAEAAQAALSAEAAARATQVMPVDPDDDEADRGNPDIDPATGLSRRPASEARPEDEGRTVFPIDTDL